jgi:hypothetical protein
MGRIALADPVHRKNDLLVVCHGKMVIRQK